MKALAAGLGAACVLALVLLFMIDADRASIRDEKVALQGQLTAMTQSRAHQESRAETCEQRRDIEQSRCVGILDDMESQCDARVRQAAEAACEIRRTAYACPAFDENRCPSRELIDAGELRRAAGAGGSE